MLTDNDLAASYQRLRDEAEQLAGRNRDLAQRATVYPCSIQIYPNCACSRVGL